MDKRFVLQKFLVEAGYCSRRRATELIRSGKVFVNGKPAESGMRVDENDEVRIGKERIALKKDKIYIKLNKPAGYVCTNRKFRGERNVFELLSDRALRATPLHIVGRLDKDSRGLVLLTNDGDLTDKLTHPRNKHEKKYEAEIRNLSIRQADWKLSSSLRSSRNWEIEKLKNRLERGIDIGEGDGVVKIKRINYLGKNKFEIILTEGKKRQIRRMFRTLGLDVIDLKRTAIGKLELGNLAEGKWECIEKPPA